MFTSTVLSTIAARAPNDNMESIAVAMKHFGVEAELHKPHRLAHFLAQMAHETAGWNWDREIWGPTEAQKRYEGRLDLGNTQPGDGSRFRGRGPIQLTGRSNYRQFSLWAKRVSPSAPDFTLLPDAVNSDPWEGLSAIWYWDSRKLNALADMNELREITRRVNGGFNGLTERYRYYDRAALVLLGYGPKDVLTFQRAAGLKQDGICGPQTRSALHARLVAAPAVMFNKPIPVLIPDYSKPAGERSGRETWLEVLVGVCIAAVLGSILAFG